MRSMIFQFFPLPPWAPQNPMVVQAPVPLLGPKRPKAPHLHAARKVCFVKVGKIHPSSQFTSHSQYLSLYPIHILGHPQLQATYVTLFRPCKFSSFELSLIVKS